MKRLLCWLFHWERSYCYDKRVYYVCDACEEEWKTPRGHWSIL